MKATSIHEHEPRYRKEVKDSDGSLLYYECTKCGKLVRWDGYDL